MTRKPRTGILLIFFFVAGAAGCYQSNGSGQDAADQACPPGLTLCRNECVDLESDPENCGLCGYACSSDQACYAGFCRVRCGNGMVEEGEQCDDGAANSSQVRDACREDCTLPRCGDGVIDSGEECDDAESNDNVTPDACRVDCLSAWCGDGVLDTGEACDGRDLAGATCESLGYLRGTLACGLVCRLDETDCSNCGDRECDVDESEVSCPFDCAYDCGNGICEARHDCVLLSDATAMCWGNNGDGQLGDGTVTSSDVPVGVSGLTGAVAISAGNGCVMGPGGRGYSFGRSCALISDGTAMCWGHGPLGDGTGEGSNVPVPVTKW
jgi:hypothetical protein